MTKMQSLDLTSAQRQAQRPGPKVCLLAYDGLCTFEFGIGVELLGHPRPDFDSWYDFKVVAIEKGPLRANGGITVNAPYDLRELARADLIISPGWRALDAPVPTDLIEALRKASARGARLASFCSGTFVLAATGLLDGRAATTHWRYAEELNRQYPEIQFQPDVLFVDNGDVLTSAGSASAIDLSLHIVRQDFGAQKANIVARRLVVSAQREGDQRQFVEAPVPRVRTGGIAPLLDTIRTNLDEDWPVARMACAANMSYRTIARRFQEMTGETALGWLKSERVSRACELLENPDLPLADVAATCGFNSMETFRREFRNLRGISPSQHRSAFAKLDA